MGDNPLQKHFVILCQQLDIEKILPYLNAERMVTPDEYETLTSSNFNAKQKREKLLLLLPRKGRQYFQNFGKCLVWSGQTDLARHIGIDVLSVPESPYPATPTGGSQLSDSQLQNAYSVFTTMIQGMAQDGHQNQASLLSGFPQTKPNIPNQHPPPYTSLPQHPPAATSNVTMATGQHPGHPQVSMATGPYQNPPNTSTAPVRGTAMGRSPYNAVPTNVLPQGHHPQPNVTMTTAPHGHNPQPVVTGPQTHQFQPHIPMATGPYPHHQQPDPYLHYPTPRPPPPQAQIVVPQPVPVHRRSGKAKVFILYCKDTELQARFNKSADDFCDDVLALADILRYSGVETFLDQYQEGVMANWDQWTQSMITQCDHVLMVCSPQLLRALQSQENSPVDMSKGKFFNHSVVNSISAPKFVPVLLQDCVMLESIPINLRMTSNFILNISELAPLIDVEDESQNRDSLVREKLAIALQDHRFIHIVNLVKFLRQELDNAPPPVYDPLALPVNSGHGPPTRGGGIPPSHQPQPAVRPTPLPRTDLKGTPEFISEEDLTKIAEVIPRDWQHLGIKLGVEYTKLEALRTKHPFDSTLATLEMIRLWQTKKGKMATRKALKQALINLNFGLVAKEIFGND